MSSKKLAFIKDWMARHIADEKEFDPLHTTYYSWVESYDAEYLVEKLLHFIGYIDTVPIAYASFLHCPCGCKRLLWRYFFVPVALRKHGVAIKFTRSLLASLAELVGEDMQIQVEYATKNTAMSQLFRYFNFKPTHQIGVSTVGSILKR